jgi:ParB-like chromosome segregation protein Spo0J
MRDEYQRPLMVDEIIVKDRRRSVDPAVVKRLAESIERLGLRHPISVRKYGDQHILVAGLHRLEAIKKLGLPGIMANIRPFSVDEARMWEISENLHRAELTKLERSEHIEEWRKLSEQEAKGAQLAHPGGKQPHDEGVKKAAEALGVTRREVERSRDIANITPEAKEAAREAGIDDNQSKLLKVAKEAPEKQVEAVYNAVQTKNGDDTKRSSEPIRMEISRLAYKIMVDTNVRDLRRLIRLAQQLVDALEDGSAIEETGNQNAPALAPGEMPPIPAALDRTKVGAA